MFLAFSLGLLVLKFGIFAVNFPICLEDADIRGICCHQGF